MLRTLLSILGFYKIYEKWLFHQIKKGKKPRHIGVILDGNRRFSRKEWITLEVGYRLGAKKVRELIDWCLQLNIEVLTLYTFSMQNFKRSKKEIDILMQILAEELEKTLSEPTIHLNEVRIKFMGRINMLPKNMKTYISKLEQATKRYSKHYINLALAYGGRTEIIDAIKQIANKVTSNELKITDIDEEVVERHLYTSHLPNPRVDMVIRTSGEERISGFLLWQSDKADLYFVDVYWPEFRKIDLLRAIRTFHKRSFPY